MIDKPIETMLCVGGARAGRRYASSRGSGFAVAELPSRQTVDVEVGGMFQPEFSIQSVITNYRREVFQSPQGEVSFWVPEDQTPLDTLKLLLATYEQFHGGAA